jgi:hypothetical protein
VLPDGNFFPDRFDGSPPAVAALFARLLDHAGLSHVKAEIGIVTADHDGAASGPKPRPLPGSKGATQSASCSSGACGGAGKIDVRMERVARLESGTYLVGVPIGEVGHPVVLTTGLVRAVSFVFLTEAEAYAEFRPSEREAVTDLAGTLLGFGALVANGAYVFMKSCGGSKVHSATKMQVEDAVLALAIFCELHAADGRAARRGLDPTQREIFDEAAAWSRSNAGLVRMLRGNRRALDADDYKIAPARGWLSRTFSFGKKKKLEIDDDASELERALMEAAPKSAKAELDPAKKARLAEIRALVEDSLDG